MEPGCDVSTEWQCSTGLELEVLLDGMPLPSATTMVVIACTRSMSDVVVNGLPLMSATPST